MMTCKTFSDWLQLDKDRNKGWSVIEYGKTQMLATISHSRIRNRQAADSKRGFNVPCTWAWKTGSITRNRGSPVNFPGERERESERESERERGKTLCLKCNVTVKKLHLAKGLTQNSIHKRVIYVKLFRGKRKRVNCFWHHDISTKIF